MYTVLLVHGGPNGEVIGDPRAVYETELRLVKERAAKLLWDAQKTGKGILPDRYRIIDETNHEIVAEGTL